MGCRLARCTEVGMSERLYRVHSVSYNFPRMEYVDINTAHGRPCNAKHVPHGLASERYSLQQSIAQTEALIYALTDRVRQLVARQSRRRRRLDEIDGRLGREHREARERMRRMRGAQ